MHLFKRENVNNNSKNILNAYAINMERYLERTCMKKEESRDLIKEIIEERLKDKNLYMQYHPVYGITEKKQVNALEFIKELDKDIITPFGVSYISPDEKKSVLSHMLEGSTAKRNEWKKKQLEAASVNNTIMELYAKYIQTSAKIFNNAVSGISATIHSFLYDIASYNAITSIGRLCVKTGYTHVERMVSGNIYLRSYDDVVDYAESHIATMNRAKVAKAMTKYKLYTPSEKDLVNYFKASLRFYMNPEDITGDLEFYVRSLDTLERYHVFYVYSLKNLFMYNEEFLNRYMAYLFKRDVKIVNEPLENIFNIEEDLFNMVLSRNFDLINREPQLHKAVKNHPEGVLNLLSICRHMEHALEIIKDLWNAFFISDTALKNISEGVNLVRKSVVVSDTDSVIFSTNELVSWYDKENKFSEKAFDMNAFIVYLISKTLEHLFLVMSTRMGIKDKTSKEKIKMKNEFYYPVFIRSPLKKHYIGRISINEGKILPKPKMDIKGANYVGSTISNISQERFRKIAEWLIDQVETYPDFSYKDFMKKIVEFENEIYLSLQDGKKDFLATIPVKHRENYKSPLQSNYMCYLLWEEVFKEKYGSFIIPNKGYLIPIKDNGKYILKPEWKEKNPDLSKCLDAFMEKYNKKAITRIIFPPTLKDIPVLLRELVHVRHIIYTNCKPLYLLSRSLGISFNDSNFQLLMSDFIDKKRNE